MIRVFFIFFLVFQNASSGFSMARMERSEMPKATLIKRIYAPAGANIEFELASPSLKKKEVECKSQEKTHFLVFNTRISYFLRQGLLEASATKTFADFDEQDDTTFSLFIGKMYDPIDKELTRSWTLFIDHSPYGTLVEQVYYSQMTSHGYKHVGQNSYQVIVEHYERFDD